MAYTSLSDIANSVHIPDIAGTDLGAIRVHIVTAAGVSVNSFSGGAGGSSTPGSPLNEYDEDTAVVGTTETTILTYTVPAATTAFIQGFVGTGTATGRFKLKVDGITVAVGRTSAAERTKIVFFQDGPISVATAGVVTITAYHEEVANQTMEVNVFGYTT